MSDHGFGGSIRFPSIVQRKPDEMHVKGKNQIFDCSKGKINCRIGDNMLGRITKEIRSKRERFHVIARRKLQVEKGFTDLYEWKWKIEKWEQEKHGYNQENEVI